MSRPGLTGEVVILKWYESYRPVLQALGRPAVVIDHLVHAPSAGIRWISEDLSRGPAAALSALLASHPRGGYHRVHTSYEAHVLTAGTLAHTLGLPEPSLQRSLLARDKYLQKAVARSAGIRTARNVLLPDPCRGLAAVRALDWPVVIKPVRDHSCNSVRVAGSPAEFAGQARAFCGPDGHRQALAEEFVAAPELHADGFVQGGRVRRISLFEYREPMLRMVATGSPQVDLHLAADLHAGLYAEASSMTGALLAAFGVQHTVFHLEFFRTPQGPVFSEVGLRPGGGLTVDALKLTRGVDLKQVALSLDLGADPGTLTGAGRPSGPAREHVAWIDFVAGPQAAGEHDLLPGVARLPGVVLSRQYPGAAAEPLAKVASVLVEGADRGKLLERLNRVEEQFGPRFARNRPG